MKCLSYTCAMLMATASLAAEQNDQQSKSDKELFQGTWEVVSSVEAEQFAGARARITADTMIFQNRKKDAITLKYSLRPTKKPKEIDTSHEIDPGKPIIQLGIYALEGNTLKLCIEAAGKSRPASFEKAGGTAHIFLLKKIRTKDGEAHDKARGIIEKAIEAQGGEAKVTKLRMMRIKLTGTIALIPGQPNLPFTIEDTWQMPNRYKSSFTYELLGKKVVQTQVIDGDKGWIQTDGQTQDLPKEQVAEMKEQKHAEDLDRLGFLKEKDIELSVLKEIKVDGKPVSGVLVKSKGHREVKLYFDKGSGLLAKREHRLLEEASGEEVLQEIVFSDYQEKDGLKHYKSVAGFRDGKKVIDGTVTEIEFFEKLDAKMFARP